MKKSLILVCALLMLPFAVMAGDYDHCRASWDGKSESAKDVKRVDPATVGAATDYKTLEKAAVNISPMNAMAADAIRKQASCADSTFQRLHPNYFVYDKQPKQKLFKHYSWTSKTLQVAKNKPVTDSSSKSTMVADEKTKEVAVQIAAEKARNGAVEKGKAGAVQVAAK